MNVRKNISAALLFAPFFILPWSFDARRDGSAASLKHLLASDSEFAPAALNAAVKSADPNLIVDGKPIIVRLGIDECRPDFLTELLARGADPNKTGPDSGPALIELLKRTKQVKPPVHSEYVRHKLPDCERSTLRPMIAPLLDRGANVRERYQDTSPLSLALNWEQAETAVISALLKAGADPNEIINGKSALDLAFDASADSDTRDALVELLLAAGATKLSERHLGDLLLSGRIALVKQLLQKGATLGPGEIQFSLEMLIQGYNGRERPTGNRASADEVFDFLLSFRPSLNVHFSSGDTPLIRAMAHPKLIKRLLEAGADPNFKDKRGFPPLFVLALKPDDCDSCVDELKLLIAHGADPNETMPVETVKGLLNVLDHGFDRHVTTVTLLDAIRAKRSPGSECVSLISRLQKSSHSK